jgi:hypothetical protein
MYNFYKAAFEIGHKNDVTTVTMATMTIQHVVIVAIWLRHYCDQCYLYMVHNV